MLFTAYGYRRDFFGESQFYEDTMNVGGDMELFRKTLLLCLRKMKAHRDVSFKVQATNGQQWVVDQPTGDGQYFRVTFSRAWNDADSEREMTRQEVIRKIVSWAGKTSGHLSQSTE